jgi:pyruvate/2-oxoglutarate dehydrogenase complex dihydrolipoamide dehydrogenase (E3) component
MTEEQALKVHPNLDIYTSSFRAMRNTLSGSPLRCLMKMIVDADSRVVIGAHMVGDHSAEIMQVRVCGRGRGASARGGGAVSSCCSHTHGEGVLC